MDWLIAQGLLIPFIGTTLGAVCVFFMRKELNPKVQRALTGFAAGVMIAASVWSLLLPAIDQSENMGNLAFIPASVGFCLGMGFLLLLDMITPHMHMNNTEEGPKTKMQKTTMMVLAVALHNIPEGMAVGVIYAGLAGGQAGITGASALALSLGIAIQNFPEGAIVSLPLHAQGLSKRRSFAYGVLSGIVEPLAGLITVLLAELVVPVLPYLLGFAAGAMIYVVVEELIPEMSEGNHSNLATVMFTLGFVLMMALDVTFG